MDFITYRRTPHQKWRRFPLRTIITAGCILVAFCAVSSAETDEYADERIDITDYFSLPNGHATAVEEHDLGTAKETPVLDFSHINDGEKQTVEYRIYGDTIIERRNDNETEWFSANNGIIRLKGIASRLYGLNFNEGVPYHATPANAPAGDISQTDTLTIVHASGASQSYQISSTYSARPGGMIITAEGDTIKETVMHIARYSFCPEGNAGSGKTATYADIRWMASDRQFPIVEWRKYEGWNGNYESATLSTVRIPQQEKTRKKRSQTIEPAPGSDLQSVTITDLGGKTLRKYTPEEMAGTIDYRLPTGWYIITEQYPDRTVSYKKHISRNQSNLKDSMNLP